MTTVDLGAARADHAELGGPWQGVPRRVGLTLTELRHACEVIGAPLPFTVAAPSPDSGLEGRLGASRASLAADAFDRAVAGFSDPAASLTRRGLLSTEGETVSLDPGIAGALGALATPEITLDVDVHLSNLRAHSWHRQKQGMVATLATVDGLVFELSWLPAAAWPAEIARLAALPEDFTLTPSTVPDHLEVPYELADAALEALRAGRGDLVDVLAHGDTTLIGVLNALAGEARGRLRAVVSTVPAATSAEASPEPTAPIGVVSWTLVGDGWRSFRPRTVDGELQLTLASVEAADLAAELAPVLAEVAR